MKMKLNTNGREEKEAGGGKWKQHKEMSIFWIIWI